MRSGLLDNGVLYRTFDETVHPGMRLGRNLCLDARSLRFMVERYPDAMRAPVTDRHWERVLAILDQGALGSCTGNAGTGALGTQPLFDAVGRSVLPDPADARAAERFAVGLYRDATVVDGYPGVYPPDDTGSSGLAVCKVLRDRHTIHGYRWASTAAGFARLLQDGPVLQGLPWYESFFEPDGAGFVDADPHWADSPLAGGHEIEAIAIEIDPHDLLDSVVTYANSWGTGWGDHGYLRMRLRTSEALDGVDLKQLVV